MNAALRTTAVLMIAVYVVSGIGNEALAQTNTAPSVQALDEATSPVNVHAQIQSGIGDTSAAQEVFSLPLAFERNDGQADGNAAFLTHSPGYSAFFKPGDVVFNIPATGQSRSTRATPNQSSDVHMRFLGSKASPEIVGEDRLPGRVNYIIGNRPSDWHQGIPLFSRVKYKSIYSGTDLVFHGDPYNLEFDFAVAPHADFNQIRLQFAEVSNVEVTKDGELLLHTNAGDVRYKKPLLYQDSGTGRRSIDGGFKVSAEGIVSFWAGQYDASETLTIDPVLTYASYFSGGSPAAIRLDSTGNIYLAGQAGPGLLTKNPYQGSPNGTFVAFVSKFDPTAKNLIFSTYIGGSNQSAARALAVDSHGNSYITGNSFSADFPTTPGAFMTQCTGICNTPFVAKFDPSGALLYSTYTGGSNAAAWGVAADSFGSAYITGTTTFDDLPLVNAFQSTFAGVFVQKLDPVGSQMLYSTYLGGAGGGDHGTAIAVDAAGSAYVTGTVGSAGFPTKNPLQLDIGTFFLTKFSPDGKSLVYSTLLGMGGQYDKPNALAIDSTANAYIAASITTMNYPLTLNAFQTACLGMEQSSSATGCSSPQAYVLAINSGGTGLLYATLLGDGGANGIAVDSLGNANVAGTATSAFFPLINNIEGPQPSGAGGAFVTTLNSSGIPTFSTYLAGVGANEYGSSIAVDADQDIFVAGSSPTENFPAVNPLQTKGTGFLAKITPGNGSNLSVSAWQPLVAVRNVGSEPVNISNLTVTSETPGITLQVSGNCGTSIFLAPAAQCLVSVTQPTYPPVYYADINVSSNLPGSPQKFVTEPSPTNAPLTLLFSPAGLRFPPEYVGTTTPAQTITVMNTAPEPVTISSVQATNPDFQVINNCTESLPGGGSCTLDVAVSPSQSNSSGTYGDINISYSASSVSGGSIGEVLFVAGQGYASGLWPSTSSQAFGSQYVGVAGMPQVVTLSNVTPSALNLGNIAVTGPFTTTTNCGTSLPAYGNCRVAVVFAPTQSGFVSGNLAVNFFGPKSPANVVLSGTGKLVSDLWVSPVSFDFGSLRLPLTETQNFTLTNNGTAPMTISKFTLSDPQLSQTHDCPVSPSKLAIGGSCSVTVTFVPTVVGSLSATLSISHTGAGDPQVIPLTGSGYDAFFQPNSLAFGTQAVGTSGAEMTLVMNNYASTPITIQSLTVAGDFQIAQSLCGQQLAGYFSCAMQVVFTPTATGSRTGTVTVVASDGQGPHVATLTGTGGTAAAVALSTSSLNFASQLVGTSSQAQTVTLTNTGNGTLKIGSIVVPGGFTQSNTCSTTLAAGSNCSISVQFAPTAGGEDTGTLTVTDDASDSPQSVTLWGNAMDFSIQSVSGTTATINAGQTATYNLQGAPAGGFTGTAILSCSGAPKEATCGVSPGSLEIFNQPGAFFVTVVTRAPSRAMGSGDFPSMRLTPACLLTSTITLLVTVLPVTRLRISKRRFWLIPLGTFAMLMFLTACGGGNSSGPPPVTDAGTPAGTYSITVMATSGSSTRTIALSLTVR